MWRTCGVRRRRVLPAGAAAALAACLLAALLPAAVFAEGWFNGGVDGNAPWVGAGNSGPGSGGGWDGGGGGTGWGGGGGWAEDGDGIGWVAPVCAEGGGTAFTGWIREVPCPPAEVVDPPVQEEVRIEDLIAPCLRDKREAVPVAEPGVGVNPALGMTGMVSYFWALNYRDNEPVYGEVHLGAFCGLDVTVETRLVPVWYVVRFGDRYFQQGSTSGVPWPVPSEYRHTYERTGTYPVSVTVTLDFAWRLPGGTWQEVGQVTRASTIQYPVQQLQSVITR